MVSNETPPDQCHRLGKPGQAFGRQANRDLPERSAVQTWHRSTSQRFVDQRTLGCADGRNQELNMQLRSPYEIQFGWTRIVSSYVNEDQELGHRFSLLKRHRPRWAKNAVRSVF